MKQHRDEQQILNARAGIKTPKTNTDLAEVPETKPAEVIFDKMERFFNRFNRA